MLNNYYDINRLRSKPGGLYGDFNKLNLDIKIEEKIKEESFLFLKEIRTEWEKNKEGTC